MDTKQGTTPRKQIRFFGLVLVGGLFASLVIEFMFYQGDIISALRLGFFAALGIFLGSLLIGRLRFRR